MAHSPALQPADGTDRPAWFEAFLADRGTRKPSEHTMKAYRQDFDAIAAFIGGSGQTQASMALSDIATEPLRAAFAAYAETHEAASIRRCWSTWNVLCTFLFTAELIPANPMPQIGRPKTAKTLPKALPTAAITDLITALADDEPQRRSDWPERDRAIILTALLAGLRTDELINTNIAHIRRIADGAVIHVRGKGNKDRRIPIELALVDILETYLNTRRARFPTSTRRRSPVEGLAGWPQDSPLFVGANGERITRGTLQYRVLRAFRKAGIDNQRARGALVHGLRHTFATELAQSDVSVYALMSLLGHESMSTSQRYVTAAGVENRSAAAQNPIYAVLQQRHPGTLK
jgi:site-specific recombinase XerD